MCANENFVVPNIQHAYSEHPEIAAIANNDARGIYHHYCHRTNTTSGPVAVDFIVLDVRYHRTSADMLGQAQWQWLENIIDQIRINEERPHWIVFVLGTTFLLQHPAIVRKIGGESWDYRSRRRFERFIGNTGLPRERILLLSGDVHFSVIHDMNGLKAESSFSVFRVTTTDTCCAGVYRQRLYALAGSGSAMLRDQAK